MFSESSAQVKEENHDVDESKMKGHNVSKIESTASSRLGKVFSDGGAAVPEVEGVYQLNAGIRKRKQKSFTLKVRTYFPAFSCKIYGFSLSLYFLCEYLTCSMH